MKDPLFEKGLKVRKQVLGADYVERQFKNADDFTLPIQAMATQAGWGLAWARPGLTRKQRSMCTICFVIARSKPEELALHLRGALRNGLTKSEIREILLQSAIYCGFPEALSAFRVAKEFFANEGDKMLASRRRTAGARPKRAAKKSA
jgi:4-carboxymuconolactone decarboxylase